MTSDERMAPSAPATSETVNVDALRGRYALERSRRMTEDRGRTTDPPPSLGKYDADPHNPPVLRGPVAADIDVAIVGAGLGGLLVGAHLRMAGIQSIRLIDRAGDVGGTWYWNRYPGAQCDVESYIYLPLLDALGYVPREKYSHQPEILAHSQAIARRFDLYREALFQTQVTAIRWNAASDRWEVSTDRGDRLRARFVCMMNGPLDKPKLPLLDGIELFKGHWFHTSRWDYGYTGGDTTGGLSRLGDKVVGIIGSGASAVQCVPYLGQSARGLYVFQRTPSTIAVRGNRLTDPTWAAGLEPGWQKSRVENFCAVISGDPDVEDMVEDGWTYAYRRLAGDPRYSSLGVDERLAAQELADLELGEQIRSRVSEIVTDPETREALSPYYWYFCKRPCFHDEYLATFNRANVHLVDVADGIERVTERGLVVRGHEHRLDCLIFATGFEVGTPYIRRVGYEVFGRDGRPLSAKWSNGVATLHGIMTSGFPNLLISPGQQGQFAWFAVNVPHALTEFAIHAAHLISYCTRERVRSFEPTETAESDWVRTIIATSPRFNPASRSNLAFQESCTPSYLNNDGHPADVPPQNIPFAGRPMDFYSMLQEWRRTGDFAGLRLEKEQAGDTPDRPYQ